MSQMFRVDATEVLRTVPFENGFHFCTYGGLYANVTATSLSDFVDKLMEIDGESIEFHYPRGDFQYWITKILGDEELGNRMCFVDRSYNKEQLRQELVRIVTDRISELTRSIEYR